MRSRRHNSQAAMLTPEKTVTPRPEHSDLQRSAGRTRPVGPPKCDVHVTRHSDGSSTTSVDGDLVARILENQRMCDQEGFDRAIRAVVGDELHQAYLDNASTALLGSGRQHILDLDDEAMVRCSTHPEARTRQVPCPRPCRASRSVVRLTSPVHYRSSGIRRRCPEVGLQEGRSRAPHPEDLSRVLAPGRRGSVHLTLIDAPRRLAPHPPPPLPPFLA